MPLTARATAALEQVPRRIDTRLVFTSPRGGAIDMHNFARRDWHPALEAAGVSRRRVYDLRHSFASNALAAGISLYELSRYIGAPSACSRCTTRTSSGTPRRLRARSWTRTRPRAFRRLVGVDSRPAMCASCTTADLQEVRSMERAGIEPATSGLQSRRSPS